MGYKNKWVIVGLIESMLNLWDICYVILEYILFLNYNGNVI